MRTQANRSVREILIIANVLWVVLLALAWIRGADAATLFALTAACLLGIFGFGSFRPLVERVYAPESQRIHPLASWLLTAHTLIMGGAVLGLFRAFPGESRALLVGLVVTPIAVAGSALLHLLRPRSQDARHRQS